MPNLVIYVPASLWKRIEELGLADPKVEARHVAVGALEAFVNGRPPERETSGRASEPVSRHEAVVDNRASRSGSCPMDTPRGVKCKACGKVH